MTTALSAHLADMLERSTQGLVGVSRKKMFGSEGFFVNGKVFALEWDDHFVFKLPAEDAATEFATLGALPWSPMGAKARPMKHWLIAPDTFNDDEELTQAWAERAYALVKALPDAKKKPKARPSTKSKEGKRS